MKELLTLVDETKLEEPAIDTGVFDMPINFIVLAKQDATRR